MHSQKLDHSLSVEYLFYKAAGYMPNGDVSRGVSFEALERALEDDGQPNESEWPYQLKEPIPWVPPVITAVWRAKITSDQSNNAATMARIAVAKIPFMVAFKLTNEFFNVQGPSYVVPAAGMGFGGHAVLAVGTATDGQGTVHFLIRNSWGSGWGNNGYAWIPVLYLEDKLLGFCEMSAI